MPSLPPDKLKRLTQRAGMLGSAHDGEIVNAARAAQRLLGELKLTWAEVIGSGALARATRAPSWASFAEHLLNDYPSELSTWESGFLESFRGRRREPSPKQLAIFSSLARRFGEDLPS